MKLRVRYGTDVSVNGAGFRFDRVTLTDVGVAVADAQDDVCTFDPMVFEDGFE